LPWGTCRYSQTKIMLKLPGLIDPHVHLREPGATHKEDYETGTASALAGGVTMVLAMPNTKPPIFDESTLDDVLASARTKARCDYAQYIGAGPDNAAEAARLAPRAAALKMYLDSTFGQLRLDDMTLWLEHFRLWPGETPIVVHAESRSMAAAIWMAQMFDKPIHIAHISLREEILLIKEAKQRGIKVTCEVCPHHLFLADGGIPLAPAGCECCSGGLSVGRAEVRPRLATKADVDALWENMAYIDCFATDHAPHTTAEKDSDNPPPGFPGLETLLPLLLTAVSESRLTIDDIIQKSVINPRKIFNLPEQPETWVEVDENSRYEIKAAEMHSRCGWTPFEGWQVRGRVTRIVLRGEEAYKDGKILARPGFGRNVRENS
jgi:carbamoyl-phosphate synthase / aspartate carbamoyltransferase / dihydroorotase